MSETRNSTTSFLTATTLVYAIGAGITAAAGTRLALQLIVVKRFKFYSFQQQKHYVPRFVISCHYLPVSGLGNLRACCLPWMWQPFLRLPLRNRTLIPRYPLQPRQSTTLPSKADRADAHADKRHRSMRYYSIDLNHPITAAIASVGFCFGQLHPTQPQNRSPEVESVRVLLTCISFGVTKVIQQSARRQYLRVD